MEALVALAAGTVDLVRSTRPQHGRDAAKQDQEEEEALRLIHAATEISLWGQSD